MYVHYSAPYDSSPVSHQQDVEASKEAQASSVWVNWVELSEVALGPNFYEEAVNKNELFLSLASGIEHYIHCNCMVQLKQTDWSRTHLRRCQHRHGCV